MITVKIDSEDSRLVEKAFYEYNASLNILSYLLKQENINMKYIEDYTRKSELYFVTLEEYKNIVSSKYHPKDDKEYEYSFDFINETINFKTKGDN